MKILMVSWEYPPVIVGGLGRHVYQLATALAAGGHRTAAVRLAENWNRADGLFGALDARRLPR